MTTATTPQCHHWTSEKCLRKSPRTSFVDEPGFVPSSRTVFPTCLAATRHHVKAWASPQETADSPGVHYGKTVS